MANHKSAIKRIRSSETKKLRNKYQHKSTRTVIKKLEQETKKAPRPITIKTQLFFKNSKTLLINLY